MRDARSKTSSEYRSSSGGNDSANSNTANNSRGWGGIVKNRMGLRSRPPRPSRACAREKNIHEDDDFV
jgi:hypothetical protein